MNRGYGNNYFAPSPSVTRTPLEGGWNLQSREGYNVTQEVDDVVDNVSEEEDDYDNLDDSYVNSASDDYYDSDVNQQSHETRKNSRWFKRFFESLECLSIEMIDAEQRQWHCPACQGRPEAIIWYNLPPLLAHGRTKVDRRVKLHREFAEVLDVDLKMRGASVIPCKIYGKWKRLSEKEKEHEVVWPPMVIIMNIMLDKVVELQQKNTNLSSKDELRKRAEEVSSFIALQEQEMWRRGRS